MSEPNTGLKEPEYIFGRPTKYQSKFCQMLIDHMSKGKSFESFGAVICIGRSVLYEWRKTHSDFQDAFNVGKEKHLEYMEKIASEHLVENFQGPKVNTGLFKLMMVNMHGWTSEKQQLGNDETKPFEISYIPKSLRPKDAG